MARKKSFKRTGAFHILKKEGSSVVGADKISWNVTVKRNAKGEFVIDGVHQSKLLLPKVQVGPPKIKPKHFTVEQIKQAVRSMKVST